MELLFASFLAGLLTVLAPCIIALLPVILGGTLGQKNLWRPFVVAFSLGLSVLIFTLLLKASTLLLGVPTRFWQVVAGTLIFLFGLTMLFPDLWGKISVKFGLYKSEKLIEKSNKKGGLWGAALLGASLGPVFSTCSPTYALILAIVLPSSFAVGLANLITYSFGLMLLILAVGYGGQAITRKLRFAVNPYGWFKRGLGVLLILTGIMIFTGLDKIFETWILDGGYLGPIDIEQGLLEGKLD